MLKRFFLALVASWCLSPLPAYAVGTIPMSMTQQLDQYGVPLSGCQLYTIQAGTTSTPQNAYKDLALSQPQPNPMICDSSGRLPQFFLADGQIKIRLLDKNGNPVVTADNVLVVGPSSGGGSGATIDPTTIAATGDIKQVYGTQILPGWVRFNGRTLGNAVSGATERANADTQALFLYLWAADPNLTVSGGRTTAAADYAANKTITLPDGRGRMLAGLADMGNSATGVLTSTWFGTSPTTLGASGGFQNHLLALSELPTGITSSNAAQSISVSGGNSFSASGVNSLTLSGTNTINVSSAGTTGSNGTAGSFVVTDSGAGTSSNAVGGPLRQLTANMAIGTLLSAGSNSISVAGTPTISVAGSVSIASSGTNAIAATSNNTGGAAHTTLPPMTLVTIYIKL